MKTKIGCSIAGIIAFLLFLALRTTPTVSWLIMDIFYIHPVSWLLGLSALVFAGAALWKADAGNYGESNWVTPTIIAIALSVTWMIWLGIQNPVKMAALARHTEYTPAELVAQDEIRTVAYSVANANISSNKFDARSKPGELNYVQDGWSASIDPNGFWVKLYRPTQGLFVFNEDYTVDPIIQPFTFSEAGMLWNSATHTIRSEEYFVEFSDILYVKQIDGKYIAVTTLIKRAGFSRYPYIYGVAVIHSSGRPEILTPIQAESDPRLEGVALVPFDFEKDRTEAYGWRNGWISGIFTRANRLEIQLSNVNDENSAPFHLKSVNGNVWYTPLAPLGANANSIVAIAMSSSHDVDGPIGIWRLAETDSLPSADFLTSLIESAPNHTNILWYRSGVDSKCGNVAVLEIVPVVRQEPTGNKIYFMGYVSAAPLSSNVKFYSVIDPDSRIVYEDLPTYHHVNSWLRGEFELTPVTQNSTPVGQTNSYCSLENLPSVPDQALVDYLRQITEELDQRLQK